MGVRAIHPYNGKSGFLMEISGTEDHDRAPDFTLCGGVRLFELAKARLEECTSSNNDITLTMCGDSSAMVRKCQLISSEEGFAVLRASSCQPKSRIVLRANQIDGAF
jgi:hypothetical protein